MINRIVFLILALSTAVMAKTISCNFKDGEYTYSASSSGPMGFKLPGAKLTDVKFAHRNGTAFKASEARDFTEVRSKRFRDFIGYLCTPVKSLFRFAHLTSERDYTANVCVSNSIQHFYNNPEVKHSALLIIRREHSLNDEYEAFFDGICDIH